QSSTQPWHQGSEGVARCGQAQHPCPSAPSPPHPTVQGKNLLSANLTSWGAPS
uniref:Uncharacterized protein n=1 Tax=Aegilops tauschii subsp. strangulata TaxID=200361 RepID=A0A453D3D0_AEGTS